MIGRRNLLKGFAGAAAVAPAAANAAEEAMFEHMAGMPGHARSLLGRGGVEALKLEFDPGEMHEMIQEALKDSANAFNLIREFGGATKAPPELLMTLTPADRERLASLNRRCRRLGRLRSMSEAAREAYATEPF